MATPEECIALSNIVGWIRAAKETLPTINEGRVDAGRIAEASALLDRMHRVAAALLEQQNTEGRRQAA